MLKRACVSRILHLLRKEDLGHGHDLIKMNGHETKDEFIYWTQGHKSNKPYVSNGSAHYHAKTKNSSIEGEASDVSLIYPIVTGVTLDALSRQPDLIYL